MPTGSYARGRTWASWVRTEPASHGDEDPRRIETLDYASLAAKAVADTFPGRPRPFCRSIFAECCRCSTISMNMEKEWSLTAQHVGA